MIKIIIENIQKHHRDWPMYGDGFKQVIISKNDQIILHIFMRTSSSHLMLENALKLLHEVDL